MAKYRRKQARVDAEQVTSDTIHDVALWCGGKVFGTTSQDYKLLVPSLDGGVPAVIGSVVTKDTNNRFSVMDFEEFNNEFEPVAP